MRAGLSVAVLSMALAGCYASHDGTSRGDGGAGCGTRECASGEQCCELCHGETLCVPADEMCPVPDCPPGFCSSNADCPPVPGFGSYCSFPPGACGGDGRCVPRGPRCSMESAPVCGCDGMTYMSACFAARAGVSIASEGPCGAPCGRGGETCSPDEYCATGPLCGADDAFLGCLPRPDDCPPDGMPVCGCDGTFYPNACVAAMLGVSVTSPDRCGGPDPSAVCVGLCDVLLMCGAPGDCVTVCIANLSDCTDDELGQVAACTATGDCMLTINCLADIPCAT